MNFKDIFYKVDTKLAERDFFTADIESQKNMAIEELKNYLIFKIHETNINYLPTEDNTVNDLVRLIALNIPKEEQLETMAPIIHYILLIAQTIQSFTVVWYVENEKKEKLPLASFNEKDLWDNITTYIDAPIEETFDFVLDIFCNHFLKLDTNVRKYIF